MTAGKNKKSGAWKKKKTGAENAPESKSPDIDGPCGAILQNISGLKMQLSQGIFTEDIPNPHKLQMNIPIDISVPEIHLILEKNLSTLTDLVVPINHIVDINILCEGAFSGLGKILEGFFRSGEGIGRCKILCRSSFFLQVLTMDTVSVQGLSVSR